MLVLHSFVVKIFSLLVSCVTIRLSYKLLAFEPYVRKKCTGISQSILLCSSAFPPLVCSSEFLHS